MIDLIERDEDVLVPHARDETLRVAGAMRVVRACGVQQADPLSHALDGSIEPRLRDGFAQEIHCVDLERGERELIESRDEHNE
ncbi:MAG TPA: hypothetical protein VF387_01600, partial [Gemmatimonadaceae bacterium]